MVRWCLTWRMRLVGHPSWPRLAEKPAIHVLEQRPSVPDLVSRETMRNIGLYMSCRFYYTDQQQKHLLGFGVGVMLKEQTCWVDFSSDGKWETVFFLFVFFTLLMSLHVSAMSQHSMLFVTIEEFSVPTTSGHFKSHLERLPNSSKMSQSLRGLRKIWSYWNFTALSQRHQQLNLQQPTCTSRPTAS